MKLAIVYLSNFPPMEGKYSGGDRRLACLAKAIKLNNPNTEILIPVERYQANEDASQIQCKITAIGNSQMVPFFMKRLLFWWGIVQYIKKNQVQTLVLYGPAFESIPFLALLKNRGTKLVLEICDQMSATNKGFRKLYWLLGEQFVPKFMNLIIVISRHLSSKMLEYAPNVAQIKIPVLVDFEAYKNTNADNFKSIHSLDSDTIIILYMGGLWKVEGVDNLLNATLELKNLTIKKFKLFIAGKYDTNNPDFVDVQSWITKNNMCKFVEYLGFLNSSEIAKVLSASDIVTLPQTKSEFNQAGLPTKMAEYSANGKAIVATNEGDISEYFNETNSVLCANISPINEISEALKYLIENEKARKSLGQNAYTIAQNNFELYKNGLKIMNKIKQLRF